MLTTIYEPIQQDLVQVEDRLKTACEVDFPHLSQLLDYSLRSGGKRVRPALVLLSAKFYRYDLECLLPMAAAIEVLHTATLVHDDAIDNSLVRRGCPTVNKEWGEDKAILLGDYMLAKAEELVADTQNLRVIKLFARTIMTLCSGELNQAFNAFNLEQTEQQYLGRIAGKTASLLTLATESGAILSQAPEESVGALKEYGYNLGIIFQIVDDVLDFIGTEEEMGKPVGSDLAEGTLTLPAMLLLQRYPGDNPVRRLFQHQGDDGENIKLAIEQVRSSSIIPECYQLASDYCAQAHRNLDLLPDNASRRSLMELADFVMARRK
jgi:geranylgeranyl pyrophosphate synthase